MFLQRSPCGVLDAVPLPEAAYADFLGLYGHKGFSEGGIL